MAFSAFVVLNGSGVVVKTHVDSNHNPNPSVSNVPSANADDLVKLLLNGFTAVREVPLTGGGVLIVLSHA